jgi:nucleotide-binding universal stress UspA family protein
LAFGSYAEGEFDHGGEDHECGADYVGDEQLSSVAGAYYVTEQDEARSEEIVAGLIVVGNQGLSARFSRMRRFIMGSVSENVTRYARCSVMVVRKDLYDRPQT